MMRRMHELHIKEVHNAFASRIEKGVSRCTTFTVTAQAHLPRTRSLAGATSTRASAGWNSTRWPWSPAGIRTTACIPSSRHAHGECRRTASRMCTLIGDARSAASHRRRDLYRPAAGPRNRRSQGATAAAVQREVAVWGAAHYARRNVRARVQDLIMSRTDAVTRILFEASEQPRCGSSTCWVYAAIAIFCYGVYVQIRKYRRGATLRLEGGLWARFGAMLSRFSVIARRPP